MRIPLGIQSAQGRSREATTERLINCYVEQQDPRAKAKLVALGRPGLAPFASVSGDPVRGATLFQGSPYALVGTTLYKVAAGGTTAAMTGTIPGTERVMMAPGRNELAILNEDGDGFVCDSLAVTQIADPDFGTASSVDYIDGYHLFSRPDSDEWFISGLVDATSYDALDFASKESAPDNIVRVFVQGANLWIFGETTTEPWQNTGNADFPFGRIGQAFIEQGLIGKHAVCKDDNSLFWVSNKRMILRADGFKGTIISTPAVSRAIGGYSAPENCEAFSYVLDGHTFIGFRFPGEGMWLYDAATQLWHEAQSYGENDWRVRDPVVAYGRSLIGSADRGALLEIKTDVYDDDGDPIERILISPPVSDFPNEIEMNRFEVDFEGGVGLISGQGSDPEVLMSYSDDFGVTWSEEIPASIGVLGDYTRRAIWNCLGTFRQRCFRLRFSDPCKFIALEADADVVPIKV